MLALANPSTGPTVPCADCRTPWSNAYLAHLSDTDRLRAKGFAFVRLPGGQVFINHCPRCEPPVQRMELLTWPNLPRLPSRSHLPASGRQFVRIILMFQKSCCYPCPTRTANAAFSATSRRCAGSHVLTLAASASTRSL